MRRALCATLAVLFLLGLAAAQTGGAAKSGKRKTASPTSIMEKQLTTMQESISAQQQQIQQLVQQLQSRDQEIEQLKQHMTQIESKASDAQQKAVEATSQTTQQQQDFGSVKNDVTDLKSAVTNSALALQETQKTVNESPLALRYKGITITPGGFLAAETVTRTRGMASDVNTPFNSVPFSASGPGHTPEFFGSGRQSRLTFLAEGKLANMKLTGYYEMDWLSAGVTSNSNQSNSYTNRQRQLWGQVATNNGWTVTGGQMWSLVTETRKAMDNRTETLPMSIDAQYVVGFSWARQFGMRVTKSFNNKFWLGMAVENAQVNAVAGSNLPSNYFVGAAGNGGGLYNSTANYSFNAMPDLIFKAAVEPNSNSHFEVFGVVSRFRNRIYPNATAATPSSSGAFNDSKTVGGIGANARGYFKNKMIEVAVHAFGGQGVGRYSTSGLADLTAHPDGTLAPLHTYSSIGEIDFHTKKWDWYFDAGGEYLARAVYPDSTGKLVGYGVPTVSNTGCGTEAVSGVGTFTPPGTGSCAGLTRVVMEGTAGFWYKIYNGPKGKLQFGPQYEYLVRNTWRAQGGDPNTNNNVFLTSFRYYLP